MNALQTRKRLLIAESELNREQLVADLSALSAGIHAAGMRASGFGSIASSAAMLVAGVASVVRSRTPAPGPGRSWVTSLVNGASLVSTLWLAVRSRSDRHRGP
jgi:hypothetical protein